MIDVVVATDASYLPWAATAIRSVLDRHPAGTVRFRVLHDGLLPREGIERLQQLAADGGASLEVLAVWDERIEALPAAPSGGRVTWFRILLPELVLDASRVLMIDADTLVVDRLDELWRTDLGGMPLAAVCNVVEPMMREHVRLVGVSDPQRYLNAGVLLMDLELMREEDSTSAMLKFATQAQRRIRWLDQDTLNVVFEGRWLSLHPRWNAMNSLWVWPDWAREVFGAETLCEATGAPAILHFEGPSLSKPWHVLSSHPWRSVYRETLARTPWTDTPLVERTLAMRLIRFLPAQMRSRLYWGLKRARRWARRRWWTY